MNDVFVPNYLCGLLSKVAGGAMTMADARKSMATWHAALKPEEKLALAANKTRIREIFMQSAEGFATELITLTLNQ